MWGKPDVTESPETWPEKLREAAKWFDLIDTLLAALTVEDNATGEATKLIDRIGAGREIQDELLALADLLDGAIVLERRDDR
jgi:hypothetical protein